MIDCKLRVVLYRTLYADEELEMAGTCRCIIVSFSEIHNTVMARLTFSDISLSVVPLVFYAVECSSICFFMNDFSMMFYVVLTFLER